MTTRDQLNEEKLKTLLSVLMEDGQSAQGATPDPDYLRAIQAISEPGEGDEIMEAHRKGDAKPPAKFLERSPPLDGLARDPNPPIGGDPGL